MKKFLFALLAAVAILGTTVTAFAMDYPNNVPDVPISEYEGYGLYSFMTKGLSGKYYLVVFRGMQRPIDSTKISIVLDNNVVRMKTGTDGVTLHFYEYDPNLNQGWKSLSTRNPGANSEETLGYTDSVFVYSDVNIYDSSGELVFPVPPVPLAEEIRGVTAETLEAETMPKLTETVLTVTLCGVGCLALVVALPLLKKVLFRFLA